VAAVLVLVGAVEQWRQAWQDCDSRLSHYEATAPPALGAGEVGVAMAAAEPYSTVAGEMEQGCEQAHLPSAKASLHILSHAHLLSLGCFFLPAGVQVGV
jgi:hypothetical protein